METIHHKYPNGTTLSKFDYAYSAGGDILTWRQQAGTNAVLWEYVYDTAGQLLGAEKRSTDAVPAVLQRYVYAYDPGGNRTSEQIDDGVVGASYDKLNRLVSQQPSGPLVFAGPTNEPATVIVAGQAATTTAANGFLVAVPVGSGTSTVAVVATDSSGNTSNQAYEVDSNGTGRSFTHDANGNMLSDGARTFEWDARNQLVAVNVGTRRSEFLYNGRQKRVGITENLSGVVQTQALQVWCQSLTCEERTADGVTVVRRSIGRGAQVGSAAQFFGADHMGNITSITNQQGALTATYIYDPWGKRSQTFAGVGTLSGFTGHTWHPLSEVWMAQFRAYDPVLGRWLSEDPIGDRGGDHNWYRYVANLPVTLVDPSGLQGVSVNLLPRGEACAAASAAEVYLKHRDSNVDDRYAHCSASCLIAQRCGEDVAKRAGDANEKCDNIWCMLGRAGSCNSADQPEDYWDNAVGRGVGLSCPPQDCFKGCSSLKGAGLGRRAPGEDGRAAI